MGGHSNWEMGYSLTCKQVLIMRDLIFKKSNSSQWGFTSEKNKVRSTDQGRVPYLIRESTTLVELNFPGRGSGGYHYTYS